MYAARTRFITEAMTDKFEQVTWPEPVAGGQGSAQPQAPLLQVRARARNAWR
jgi:DNA helicase-2/ATP-dependent DNA helicase PcrA